MMLLKVGCERYFIFLSPFGFTSPSLLRTMMLLKVGLQVNSGLVVHCSLYKTICLQQWVLEKHVQQ